MPDLLKFTRSYDEVGNIRTFVFETGGLKWQPGQYQTYTLTRVAGDDKASRRFFTIASAPFEDEVHISTRVTDSAFKQVLNVLQPGETIQVQGLEGDFTWDDSEPVVLVAAGIGSTPYRSMLLQRHHDGVAIPATLVYFVRDDKIPFKSEFDAIAAAHNELVIHYVVGEPVTAEAILHYAPLGTTQTMYLSGPEAMVENVGEALKAQGVTLKQDWFPGYSEADF